MIRHTLLFLLFFFGNCLFAYDELEVKLALVKPTQTGIGNASVNNSMGQILEKAKRLGGISQALATRKIRSVIAPDGSIYLTDGHHWATAAARIAAQNPELADSVRLTILVHANFQGKPWLEFVQFLESNNVGYFPKSIRDKYQNASPEEKIKLYREELPKNLLELIAHPGRDIIGLTLSELGMPDDTGFKDYVEFYFAERFEEEFRKEGVVFEDWATATTLPDSLLKKAARIMSANPEMISFLLQSVRSDLDTQRIQNDIVGYFSAYRATMALKPLRHEPNCVALFSVL